MKKRTLLWLFLGLMAIAGLAFTACNKEKGGTIEVINNYVVPVVGTGAEIEVTVTKVLGSKSVKRIPAKGTEMWIFDEDGTYTVNATVGNDAGIPLQIGLPKTVSLSGGKTETVTIK